MIKKPIIAIDIDDVIAANAASFVDYSNKKYGTHLTIDDYQEHWAEVWKVEQDEVKKRAIEYHESGHVGTYPVIEGAAEALKKLKERFKFIAVTSRRNSINRLTREWVQKYYPDIFDDIVFCGFFDSEQSGIHLTKGDLVKNIGAEYFIDDQIKHVAAVAKNGIKSLLFGDYFWNRSDDLPENVIRVKNWQGIIDYFFQDMQQKLDNKGNEKKVAIAVMVQDGKVLTGHRHYTKEKWKDVSVWTIPGGRCEAGETIRETLQREVSEEVGISEFEILDYIGEVPGAKEGDEVLIFYCTTNQEAKLMEPEKFSEWVWLPINDYIAGSHYSGFNPHARKMIAEYLQRR